LKNTINQKTPSRRKTTAKSDLALQIEEFSYSAGADLFGITDAKPSSDQKNRIVTFLVGKRHGAMKYLENPDLRTNPQALLPGARSIIVIGLNYYRQTQKIPPGHGRVAKYAYGRDYHKVVKNLLKKIEKFLLQKAPGAKTLLCTDSAPLAEKHYAQKAGLGFIGRNTTLINPKIGSFFVLGELITDIPLVPQQALLGNNACGTCTRCIDSCPTKALIAPYQMDARKCISYQTIENKGKIPSKIAKKIAETKNIFGCDICQEVCPYNKAHAKPTRHPDFQKKIAGDSTPLKEILKIKTDAQFVARFAGSPLMRAKRKGLQRNARILLKSSLKSKQSPPG